MAQLQASTVAGILTTTGNVGIGITNPQDPLHIVTSGGDKFIRIENSNSYTGLWLNDGGTNNGWLVLSGFTDSAVPGDFAIREYGVQTSLTIKQTSGNVGIGTSNPSSRLSLGQGIGPKFLVFDFPPTGVYSGLGQDVAAGNSTDLFAHSASNLGFLTFGKLGTDKTTYTEWMRITPSGIIGIGTISPSYALDVYNTGASTARVRVVGTTNFSLLQAQNTSGVLYLGVDDSSGGGFTTGAYSRIIWSSGAYPLIFAVNDAERMRITSGGNVGIGTADPSVGGTVDSKFTIIQSDNSTAIAIYAGTSRRFALNPIGNGGFTLFDGGSATFNAGITQVNGNVGINTTSPAYKLQVNGNFNATNPMINSEGTSNDQSVMQWRYGDSDAYRLRLKQTVTSGVVRWNFSQTNNNSDFNDVLVLDRGSVGIGNTNPAYKLDVDGGASTVSARFYNSSNIATVIYIGDSGNTDYSNMVLQTNSGTGEIFKAGTGFTSYGGALALNIYNSNGAIAFHPNNTANAMFISTSSNVGIGNTTPNEKLELSVGN